MMLSAIMTNYNHGAFLPKRLQSILEQLPPDSELVIVDDASTDQSLSIIETFQDPRIRVFKNQHNQGVVKSVNIALQAAKGKYIVSLAADDRILPGFIAKTMQVLLDHPEIPLCCSDCGLSFDGFPEKDPETVETTILYRGDPSKEYFVFPPEILPQIFRSSHFWIPGHTSIIKKESLLKYGGFQEKLEFLCDWFLIHSIALNEGVAYIPQTLSVWRRHQHTYSFALEADTRRKRNVYWNMIQLLNEKRHRHLRKLFKRSAIIDFYIRELFYKMIWYPRQWDLVIPLVLRVLKRRYRRFWNRAA